MGKAHPILMTIPRGSSSDWDQGSYDRCIPGNDAPGGDGVQQVIRQDTDGVRKGTNGVSTNGVTANFIFVDIFVGYSR